MAVLRGPQALDELRHQLGSAPGSGTGWPDKQFGTVKRAGFEAPDNWLWETPDDGAFVPLREHGAYRLGVDRIHRTPFEVLYDEPRRATTADDKDAENDRTNYCRHSADITMRGGTTSGVVYPLAVCEIARTFRLRNVGGASAGAIAAAAAAAAEVGRVALDGAFDQDPEFAPPELPDEERRNGHVRQGFVGLADTMAWLAEADEPEGGTYRVAQLFRPATDSRQVFRLAVAVMRKRPWSLPLLVVGAFGWATKIAAWTVLVLTVALLAAFRSGWPGPWGQYLSSALLSAGGLVGACVLLLGLAGVAVQALRSSPPEPPQELAEPVHETGPTSSKAWHYWTLAWPSAAVLAGTAVVALPASWQLRTAVVVAAVLMLLALFVDLAAGIGAWVLGAKRHHFGVVPGSVPSSETKRSFWDRLAGVPEPSVDRALIPWLSGTLSELSGLAPGQVLRFGHLWWGSDFDPQNVPTDARERAADPHRRLVNLELMSSELVRGLAYRFPLAASVSDEVNPYLQEALYVRAADLDRGLFPPDVVAVLTDPTLAAGPVRNVSTGETLHGLFRLPEPWNFPVIVAVRLSLSLPVLFEAVRLYRRVYSVTVRDDFGRPLKRDDAEVRFPPASTVPWVDEVWFTDGGVTSNFPIHFFDSVLPVWPTFGINLGDHPPGFTDQDVWLPQDWQGLPGPAARLDGGIPAFVGANLDTARAWRDNAQTVMPGYRGRVAWVRQRPDEGGTNLFMPRETIASLALRGVLAGARLRRRFSDDCWWQRHQWLRLRTSLENLEDLRRDIACSITEPWYTDAVSGGALPSLREGPFRADPEKPPPSAWFEPTSQTAFDAALGSMATSLGDLVPAPVLTVGDPRPAPQLRQVPPQ
jgi:predicted acylesterase/phospholipase RssA